MISRFGVVVDRVYLLCSTSAACEAIDWVPRLWRNKTQLVIRTTFNSYADSTALSNVSHPLTSTARYHIRDTVTQKAIVAHALARKYKHILVLTEKVTPIKNPATSPSLPVASLLSRVGAVRLAYNMLKPRRFKDCESGSCHTLPYYPPRACRMFWFPHQMRTSCNMCNVSPRDREYMHMHHASCTHANGCNTKIHSHLRSLRPSV